MNAAVKPTYTLGSSSCVMPNEGAESGSSADGEYSSERPQKKIPRKRPTKKCKSRSSASEMLTFLQEYQEKKRKQWKTKTVKMMEEMNEDKKLFWANLLQMRWFNFNLYICWDNYYLQRAMYFEPHILGISIWVN